MGTIEILLYIEINYTLPFSKFHLTGKQLLLLTSLCISKTYPFLFVEQPSSLAFINKIY